MCSALAALLLGVAAAPAQSVNEAWVDVATLDEEDAVADQGIEMAYWDAGGGAKWVFVAGFVTDPTTESATRIAVWKYDAEDGPDNGVPEDVAYFPPLNFSVSGLTKATGVAIDTLNGHVYVTGYTKLEETTTNWPQFGSDYNYITIKYDDDLEPVTSWTSPGTGVPAGFKLYDGYGQDDKAVDVTVDLDNVNGPFVYVTGSSYADGVGPDTGLDIVTLKYEQDGSPSATWDPPYGVRRYDHNGYDDYPVGIQLHPVTVPEDHDEGYWVFVGGTAGNGTNNDLLAIGYDGDANDDTTAQIDGDPVWASDFQGSGQDVAASVAFYDHGGAYAGFYVTGYSEVPNHETDFVTVAYDRVDGSNLWTPEHRYWEGPVSGGVDFATSMVLGGIGDPPNGMGLIWVTGRSEDEDGEFDASTILYDPQDGTLLCEHSYEFQDEADDRGAAIAADDNANAWVGGSTVISSVEWALTMRLNFQGSDLPEPCELIWSILHPLSDAINPNSALGILIADNGGLGPFITGFRTQYTTGQDALTVRYEETSP